MLKRLLNIQCRTLKPAQLSPHHLAINVHVWHVHHAPRSLAAQRSPLVYVEHTAAVHALCDKAGKLIAFQADTVAWLLLLVLQMLNFHSINETQRIFVIDDRQNIVYASDAMAKMLGVTTAQLTTMALPNFVVAPCAYLHKRWIAVRMQSLSHTCRR